MKVRIAILDDYQNAALEMAGLVIAWGQGNADDFQ